MFEKARRHGAPRLALAALVSTQFGSCGGGGDGGSPAPAPRFVVATHGTADFSEGGESCPWDLDFSIFLEAGGTGWVSIEHEEIGSNLAEVSWQEINGTIQVISPEVSVDGLFVDDPYYMASVGWTDLSFQIDDADGDGSAETGGATITLTCEEWSFYGDTFEQDVAFELEPASQTVSIGLEDSDGLEPIFTFADSITARSSRPLLAETTDGIRLLADGVEVAATIVPLNAVGPLADGIVIQPTGNVPFSAALGVDTGEATDGVGMPVEFDGFEIETVSDPGPLTVNPSFETDGGWIGMRSTPSDSDFVAPDGDHYGYVAGDLVGYFDVPSDASTLTFEVAIYGDLGDCPGGPSVWARASKPLPRVIEHVDPIDCDDCEAWGKIIPWHTWTYDISGVRGERVVVQAARATYTECAPDLYPEMELDDFRVQ